MVELAVLEYKFLNFHLLKFSPLELFQNQIFQVIH